MYHRFDIAVNKTTGVPIPGTIVRVFDQSGAQVSLFADTNGTPIESVSGIANAAVADDAGNYSYYVGDGIYDERIYSGDVLVLAIPNLTLKSGTDVDPNLSSIKNASIDNISRIYNGYVYHWTSGDYTGQTDDDTVIASNVADISTGAWIKQSLSPTDLEASTGAGKVGAADGNTVQANLDRIQTSVDGVSTQVTNLPNPVVDTPPLARGLLTSSSSVLFLGDSFMRATGASAYNKGYGFIMARSVLNANDHGYGDNAGYGYPIIVNMQDAVAEAGATLNGASYLTTGVVAARLSIPDGAYIQITGRQLAGIDVIYDADASTGSIVWKLNGATVATKAVSGTGLQNTFWTKIAGGGNTDVTDVVQISASGGTIVVTALLPLRDSSGPLVYVAAEAGTGYQDYTSTSAMDELAYYLNLFRATSPKLMVLCLGTNNIYNSGKALSPSATVAQMTALIAGINTRCTNVTYKIQIPPQANETAWPVIVPGYTYQDYVNAIRDFARDNGYGIIFNNLTDLTGHYSDNLHPNDTGHLELAATATDALGIPINPSVKTLPGPGETGTLTLDSNWTAFAGLPNSARKFGNTVYLTGIVAPGPSATGTVLTLPTGYRPIGRTCYFTGRTDAGAASFSITTAGVLALATVPTSWFSLEGITFQISQ